MKKKTKVKAKPSKRSAGSAAEKQQETPDLIAAMMGIAQRLEGLERKLDLILDRQGSRASGPVSEPEPGQRQEPRRHDRHEPHERPQHHRQPPPQGTRQNHGNHNQGPHAGHSQGHGQGQHPHRGGRPLHQAVCSDCQADCEVPFKPTGDRPVYCKECFAKRKAKSHPPKAGGGHIPEPGNERHVKVFRKGGVGRVTVSEIVGPLRHGSPKRKHAKPGNRR